MKFFFILGALVIASAWMLPQSFVDRHDLNRKKVLFFGISIFAIGLLILVFHSWYFLLLFILAAFIYDKYFK